MIRRHGLALRLALAAFDAVLAVLLLGVAVAARAGSLAVDVQLAFAFGDPRLAVAVYAVLWPAALWTQGLYRHRARWTARGEVGDVVRATVIFAAAALSLLYLFKVPDASRLVLIVLFPLLATAAILTRLLLRRALTVLRQRGRNTRYLLVIGTTAQGQAFADLVEAHTTLGFQVVGHLSDGDTDGYAVTRPVLGHLDAIEDVLHSRVVDEVAICLPVSEWPRIDDIVRLCEDEGKIVRIPMGAIGHTLAAGKIEELDGLTIYSVVAGPDRAVSLLAKRLLDLAGAMVMVIILSPLMVAIALWIRFDSPGPVLFRQRRVGLHGRTFEVWKFRTMVADAEQQLDELRGRNEIRGNAFKITDDPRVTAVGRRLRRTSLDELPQLINVIRGEMSLVGPRPPLPSEVEDYDVWHRRRLSMRPGMTGLWQVSARREPDFDRWVESDLEYIDNWSFWLDIKVLVMTIPAVVQGSGR